MNNGIYFNQNLANLAISSCPLPSLYSRNPCAIASAFVRNCFPSAPLAFSKV